MSVINNLDTDLNFGSTFLLPGIRPGMYLQYRSATKSTPHYRPKFDTHPSRSSPSFGEEKIIQYTE